MVVRAPFTMHTYQLKIDHNHPDVAKDLLAWGSWVLQVRLLTAIVS